jgi:nucleoside-triphosphatase
MNVLLTGVPGVGKTTVIERIAASLGGRAGGFVTKEMREAGRRTGFAIESLDGKRRVLATRHRKGGPRVGPYRVSIDNLEEVAIGAMEDALKTRRIVVVDEIGKMELLSGRFRDMIVRVLDSDVDVIATLGVARNPFLDMVRNRPDVEIVEVTMGNRNDLAERVVGLIAGGS